MSYTLPLIPRVTRLYLSLLRRWKRERENNDWIGRRRIETDASTCEVLQYKSNRKHTRLRFSCFFFLPLCRFWNVFVYVGRDHIIGWTVSSLSHRALYLYSLYTVCRSCSSNSILPLSLSISFSFVVCVHLVWFYFLPSNYIGLTASGNPLSIDVTRVWMMATPKSFWNPFFERVFAVSLFFFPDFYSLDIFIFQLYLDLDVKGQSRVLSPFLSYMCVGCPWDERDMGIGPRKRKEKRIQERPCNCILCTTIRRGLHSIDSLTFASLPLFSLLSWTVTMKGGRS